jgi:hypothetical protein|tara:strand:- start:3823 stop:4245 length:423 start_codon:yes stop_codon:yes gene_type:complete
MEEQFELDFNDLTMLETEGLYEDVNKKMVSDFPYSKEWMIKTKVILKTPNGICEMVLNLAHDKSIYIIEYSPSQSEIFYNSDLTALSYWAQKSGWKVPMPHPDLIKSQVAFWRHFWETTVVDSPFLDTLFGERSYVGRSS